MLNRSHSASHAHNRLLVTTTTAADVSVAAAERVLGGAGLSHVASTRWTLDRSVHMRLTRPDEQSSVISNALTVPFERLWDTVVQVWLSELSMVEAAQLADRQLATAAACESSWHAVSVEGAPASWCNLRILELDGTRMAQIEDVLSLPAHRGRGHASTVVRHAVATARDRGCDAVWLGADANDWPQPLYRKLGFDDAGRASCATLTDAGVLTHVPGSQDHR